MVVGVATDGGGGDDGDIGGDQGMGDPILSHKGRPPN